MRGRRFRRAVRAACATAVVAVTAAVATLSANGVETAGAAATSMPGTPSPTPAGGCTGPAPGIVFVVDESGSMAYNDPTRLRREAVALGLHQLIPGTVVAMSTFDFGARETIAPAAVTRSTLPGLESRVNAAPFTAGGTDYDVAFVEAKRQLDRIGAGRPRAVVFLSDGEPNYAYAADRAIAAMGVPIHTIGFGLAPEAELRAIADRSGGEMIAGTSIASVQPAFARLASRIQCDTTLATADVAATAGTAQSFTFDVPVDAAQLLTLVTWGGGVATIRVTRPDGSVVDTSRLRSGETFEPGRSSGSLDAAPPMPGTWRVEVVTDTSTTVTFDAWTRGTRPVVTPPTPVVTQPSPPVPASVPTVCGSLRLTLGEHRTIVTTWDATGQPAGTTYRIEYAPWGNKAKYRPVVTTDRGPVTTPRIVGGGTWAVRIATLRDGAQVGAWCWRVLRVPVLLSFNGTNDADQLTGTDGLDVLRGFGAADELRTAAGDDTAWGGAGDDLLVGGPGRNKLLGETGDDRLLGGAGADQLDGGPGDDVLDGGAGTDVVRCGPGEDVVHADALDQVAKDCERVVRPAPKPSARPQRP